MILQPIIITGVRNTGKWTFADAFGDKALENRVSTIILPEEELAYRALAMCGANKSTNTGSLKKQLTKISIQTGEIFNFFEQTIHTGIEALSEDDYDRVCVLVLTEDPTKLEGSLNRIFTSTDLEVSPTLSILIKRNKKSDPVLFAQYSKMAFDYRFDISEGVERTKEAGAAFFDMIK